MVLLTGPDADHHAPDGEPDRIGLRVLEADGGDDEIADGVVIEPGSYHYMRYRLEWAMAAKRRISGQLTWWFGGFYDGTLDQFQARVQLRPS